MIDGTEIEDALDEPNDAVVEVEIEGGDQGDGADVAPELPADSPAADGGEPAADAPSVDDALAEIKARLEAAESDRQAQAARAAAEAARAAQAEQNALEANKSLITNAIEARKQARDALKARLAEAKRAQDYEAEIDLQDELTRNTYEISQLEAGMTQLERAPAPRQQPRVDSDPAAALAGTMEQQGFKRSAEWLRQHPEYARDPKKYQKMLAAHNLAVSDDIEPDTDAYFQAVEATLGIRKSTPAPVQQREAPPPAAPVGRQAATVGGATRPNVVRLTAEQVELAEAMGMTPKEYAAQMLALKKEGKL